MLRILKSLLAESSYFFEKYFGATSIAWSVIFVAFCSAVIIGSTVKGLFWVIGIKKNKKKKSLMPFDFNAYFISLPKL